MNKDNKKINAAIIIIGNEILSGRTQDVNVVFLSKWLNELGIIVEEVRVIKDDEEVIVNCINEVKVKFKYVFTTGGIGPTHDDITSHSIAKAFKMPYGYHKEAYEMLEKHYKKGEFNEGRKKMAKMPEGSRLIYNPSSSAPGFIIKNVICLPGVPSILKSMTDNLRKFLKPGIKTYSLTISAKTIESKIAKRLENIQKKYKKFVEIGSYPFFRLGKIGVSIVMRSSNKNSLQSCHKDIIKMIKNKKIKIFKGC